jgi:exopolysaccharide biosynthesis polyprenyl glycosylphosphotransferase
VDSVLPSSEKLVSPASPRSVALLHRYSATSQSLLLVADVLAFFASFYVAMGFVDRDWHLHNFVALILGSAGISIALWIVIFAKLGMYKTSAALSARDELYYTVAALAIGIAPQLLLFTIVPQLSPSRLLFVVAVGCAVLGVGGSRAVIRPTARALEHRTARRVLVVAFGSDAPLLGTWVPKHWVISRYRSELAAAADGGSAATLERIAWFRAAARDDCDTIVIGALLPPPAATHVFDLAARYGIRVAFAPPELIGSQYEVKIEREGRQNMLVPLPLRVMNPAADFSKTVFDRSLALVGLALLSPLMALIAIAIRIEGPGPSFFKQERVGRFGRPFRVWKFRSMRVGAGHEWATHKDSRITRVGAFIRRFSLDELPQLFNVLRGEMSLVGPRPEMCAYADVFARKLPRYAERHLVRPGITGWTQINMRRHLTPDDAGDVLEHDLFYIENWSILLDVSILLKTASEFLFHRGV